MPVCFPLTDLRLWVIPHAISTDSTHSFAPCIGYKSPRVLHSPAGLIDGSTYDTFAKAVGAKCSHQGGILHKPLAKYW